MSHTREHEELLERVLARELERSDERVLAVTRACAQCRLDLEELVEALGAAESAGGLQRSVLAEALPAESAPDPDWARRTLEARGLLPATRSRRRPLLALAAAAAVLVTLTLLWRSREHEQPGPIVLGDGLELVQPVGESPDLGVFSWRFDLPASGYYELRVWERLQQGGERPLFEQPNLDTNTWQADPDVMGPVRRIRWSVEAYDAGGQLMDREEALAELSP